MKVEPIPGNMLKINKSIVERERERLRQSRVDTEKSDNLIDLRERVPQGHSWIRQFVLWISWNVNLIAYF